MGRKNNFEYIIIGSGPAGATAALLLAKAKKKVCVVEENNLGGSHLNTRNIPYLVSLTASHDYANISHSPEIRNQSLSFSLPALYAHQQEVIKTIGLELKEAFKTAGISYFHGAASFLDSNTIAIGDKKLTADNFILATGSVPNTADIIISNNSIYLTPETATTIRRLPKVVVVIGGGSAGCEIAEFYAELGSKVIILEMADRLLPREDTETSNYLSKYFTDTLGITVLTKSKAVELYKDSASRCVVFQNNRNEKLIRAECIVMATGSKPALNFGLENAGIKYKTSGITTNKFFQTSTKHIYAIGDCRGEDSSTERSRYEGFVLATNLLSRAKNVPNYSGFTRTTKTFPEIVSIGASEESLKSQKRKYKKAIFDFSMLTISKVSGGGFIKLLADKTNHIIGATIVSPHAELLSSEISMAIRHGLTAQEIASTSHAYDNYSYAIRLVAKQLSEAKN